MPICPNKNSEEYKKLITHLTEKFGEEKAKSLFDFIFAKKQDIPSIEEADKFLSGKSNAKISKEMNDSFKSFMTGLKQGTETGVQAGEMAQGRVMAKEMRKVTESKDKRINVLLDKLERSEITIDQLRDKVKELGYETAFKQAEANLAGEIAGKREGRKEGVLVEKKLQKEFADRVNTFLKESEKLRGKLSNKQVNSIIRKASSIGTSERAMKKFTDYVEKVVANENYNEDLADANTLKGQLKKTFSDSADLVKRMKSIDVENLSQEDLDAYRKIAKNYVNSTKQVSSPLYKPFDVAANSAELKKIEDNIVAKNIKDIEDAYGVMNLSKEEADLLDEFMSAEDQDAFEQNLSDSKRKQLRYNLERIADYSKIGLREHVSMAESGAENPIVKEHGQDAFDKMKFISQADLSILSSKELSQLTKTMDNFIINNSASNITNVYTDLISKINLSKLSQESAKYSKTKLGAFARVYYNLPASLKGIFGIASMEAKYRYLTGYDGMSNAHTKSEIVLHAKKTGLVDRYEALIKQLGAKNDNIFQVTSDIHRNVIQVREGSENQDFSLNKMQIEKSIESLINSGDEAKVATGELIQGIYESTLKDFTTYEEYMNNFQQINPNEHAAVMFFIDEYKKNAEEYKRFSSQSLNRDIDVNEIKNYTPKNYQNVLSQTDVEDGTYSSTNKVKSAKDTGRSMDRYLYGELPKNKVLDIGNFQFNLLTEYGKMTFEQNAYEHIETFKKMTSTSNVKNRLEFDRMVGGEDNSNFLINDFNLTKNLFENGVQSASNLRGIGLLNAFESARAAGSVVALSSGSQFVKQMTPALNTIGQTGKYYFEVINTNVENIPLLNQSSIGGRGIERAIISGAGREERLKFLDLSKKYTQSTNIKKYIKEKRAKFAEWSLTALTATDVRVAKKSWLSFYLQYMNENGVKVEAKDLPTEHLRIDELRKEAMSYAEQKTSLTQAPSKKQQMSFLQKQKADIGLQLAQNALMPFNNFASNNRARTLEDFRKITFGSKEQKAEALKSVLSYSLESAGYSAVKVLLVSAIYKYGLKKVIGSAFGLDDNDKDFWESVSGKFKDFYTSATREFLFSGFGSTTENFGMQGLNYLGYKLSKDADGDYFNYLREDPLFKPQFESPKGSAAFYLNNIGGYGILFREGVDAINNIDAGFSGKATSEYQFEKQTKKNNYTLNITADKKVTVELSEKEQNFYKWLGILEAISLATNLRDNDVFSAAKSIQYDMLKEKRTKTTKGLKGVRTGGIKQGGFK